MTPELQEASTGKRIAVACGSAVLLVFGVFQATTAYGSWGSWLIAALALTVGVIGFVWAARAEVSQRGRMRLPLWLVLLGAGVVFVAICFGLVAAVCGNESGFSCGG